MRGGWDANQCDYLEKASKAFAHAMRLAAREIVTNTPPHPELDAKIEEGVRATVELAVMTFAKGLQA